MIQGNQMVWQALKVACESTLDGDDALAKGKHSKNDSTDIRYLLKFFTD